MSSTLFKAAQIHMFIIPWLWASEWVCAKIKHKKNQIESKMEMCFNSNIYSEASTNRDFGFWPKKEYQSERDR